MIITDTFEIEQSSFYGGEGGSKGIALVFPHLQTDPKNVLEHLIWRHQVDYTNLAANNSLKFLVLEELKNKGLVSDVAIQNGSIEFKFSRKAGCTCPCSPGIVVRHKTSYLNSREMWAIWVKITSKMEIR